ncbi:MAG: WD40 repeat domain-containing protein [Burkholderiales bacterium]
MRRFAWGRASIGHEVANGPSDGRAEAAGWVQLLGQVSVEVTALAVAPDGQTVAAGHADGLVRLLRPRTGLELQSYGHDSAVLSLAISPDGGWLAIGTQDGEVHVIDLRHGREHSRQPVSGEARTQRITCLAFSPDSRRLAVAAGVTVRLLDVQASQPLCLLSGHADAVTCLAYSPDGAWLASGALDGSLHIWQAETGTLQHGLQRQGPISALCVSSDSLWLAFGTRDGTVVVSQWTPERLDRLRQIEGQGPAVVGLAFSADSLRLAVGKRGRLGSAAADGGPPHLRLWDTQTGHLADEHGLGDILLSRMAYSPDGRWLACGTHRGEVRLMGTEQGDDLRSMARSNVFVTQMALSADGLWLASGSEEGVISLWDPATRRLHKTLKMHAAPVVALAFSADGRWMVSGGLDGGVVLWGRGDPRLLQGPRGLSCLAFSGDGRWLALGGAGGTMHLCDLQAKVPVVGPALLKAAFGITALAFSAGDRWLAVGSSEGTVHQWDLAAGRLHGKRKAPGNGLASLAVSADGRWLASGARDGSVGLWSLTARTADDAATLTLSGLTRPAAQLRFSRDGAWLGAACERGEVHVWSLPDGARQASHPAAAARYRSLGLAEPVRPLTGHGIEAAGLWLRSLPRPMPLPATTAARVDGERPGTA